MEISEEYTAVEKHFEGWLASRGAYSFMDREMLRRLVFGDANMKILVEESRCNAYIADVASPGLGWRATYETLMGELYERVLIAAMEFAEKKGLVRYAEGV